MYHEKYANDKKIKIYKGNIFYVTVSIFSMKNANYYVSLYPVLLDKKYDKQGKFYPKIAQKY